MTFFCFGINCPNDSFGGVPLFQQNVGVGVREPGVQSSEPLSEAVHPGASHFTSLSIGLLSEVAIPTQGTRRGGAGIRQGGLTRNC